MNPQPQYQNGLRDLTKGRGPSIRVIQKAIMAPDAATPGLRALTSGTESMPDSTARQRAQALWLIIREEIETLRQDGHLRCNAALRAAFRIDMEVYRGPEYDSREARLKQARRNGDFGPPDHVSASIPSTSFRNGLAHLAQGVTDRFERLSKHLEDWELYRSEPPPDSLPSPAAAQPVLVDLLRSTYIMKGRSLSSCVTERLVTAQRSGVDRYVVRAGSPEPGDSDRPWVSPLLNCRAGHRRIVPSGAGGRTIEVPMIFPRPLQSGEQCFFASQVTQQRNELPIVEIQVTSKGIVAGGLTMRIQFDEIPVAAWWFGDCIDAERLDKPPLGHRRRLTVTAHGFLEHTFSDFCKPRAKYGIGWEWARGDADMRSPANDRLEEIGDVIIRTGNEDEVGTEALFMLVDHEPD